MSNKPIVRKYKQMNRIIQLLRNDFKDGSDFVLLYAYNGIGKTRLSMEFKDAGKRKNPPRDTLYFNAFTEDLFHWDNDLENDAKRSLKINKESHFFDGFKELALEEKIFEYLERYTDFNFKINYDNWQIIFYREELNPRYRAESAEPQHIERDYIKISRGEEVIFIWCLFLAIVQLVNDKQEAYSWVKYI
jgi:hypothetical protein